MFLKFNSILATVKKLLYILLPLFFLVAATEGPFEKYISKYSSLAVSEMQRTGVPASITLAQGLLESAAGESALAVKANNHFGIKCHNDWRGKKMHRDDDKVGECFRVYPNVEASYRDHSDFLRFRDRYKKLFELQPTDYMGWARGLKEAGYATDPNYADKLIKVIEDYDLYKFDSDIEVPEAPLEFEKPVVVPSYVVREEYRFALTREVYEINGVPCIYAIEGDTYKSIAEANNLFLKELLRFNDLSKAEDLKGGEVVYLQPKKARAVRGSEKYIVGEDGESLRGIAQRFGVKLSALRRMNKLSADYVPAEGDTIILRRR